MLTGPDIACKITDQEHCSWACIPTQAPEYLAVVRALWGACQELGEQRGCPAQLHSHNVASVEALQAEHGPFDGTVVAAGAAAGILPEIGVLCQRKSPVHAPYIRSRCNLLISCCFTARNIAAHCIRDTAWRRSGPSSLDQVA
jgi:hypothetical protein